MTNNTSFFFVFERCFKIHISTDDGKLNLKETKILMSKDLEKKKMICHFKATDTNHDLLNLFSKETTMWQIINSTTTVGN